ncbi:MAG: phosphatase PAP2 family protein [Planctomycetaceae bacterium]|nr:phosphatase PAP2 family protein [Planctomycetaceae bacterium]
MRPVWEFVRRFAVAWGGQEPVVLVTFLLLVIGVWTFLEIADEVAEGSTQAFDVWVVQAMRRPNDLATPVGPSWLQEIGRDATALGGYGWLIFFTAAIAGFLWLDRKSHMAVFLVASVTGGYLVSMALKWAFQRPRPDVVPHLSNVYSTSFPSGHSMNSAVVYLTLGTLIAASVSRRSLKVYVIVVATFISGIVGVSRVYLGVHYPTDVLGGWTAGLVWALACWLAARFLQRKGRVERPEQETTGEHE